MIRINIHDAKTHLSRYLQRLLRGESIILCKRNVPIAEIRRLPSPRTEPRPIGGAKGVVSLPAPFFEPLPDEMVDAFEGNGA